jgi:Holliday junction resolvase-like predicted endonuclease
MQNYNDFYTTSNVKKFETEDLAEDYAETVLLEHGFKVFRQVEITPHGRVDIVAKKVIDNKMLVLPIEVKAWFRSSGAIARAAAQASYYAHHKNTPFFLGPITEATDSYLSNLHSYLSFMCRGNVGAMVVQPSGLSTRTNLRFYLEPNFALYEHHYSKWHGKWIERVQWNKWGMRTQKRSESKFTIKNAEEQK